MYLSAILARCACALIILGLAWPVTGWTQGVGQSSSIELDKIQVTGEAAPGSPTSPTAQEAREALRRVPGGIGFVEAETFLDEFTQSLGDTLVFTPGVYADTSAQRENRISIRGSGLNSSFERRGITVLRDGIPISRASGSTEFQEVDPLSIRYLEVYKGANGLRYGAASLGGAINVVTPTGRTARDRIMARLEGGSFGSMRANFSYAQADDDSDFYFTATGLNTNGFRDHSDVKSGYSFANYGLQINDHVETRFYLTALSDNFELAGSLSLDDALNNPRRVSPAVTIGPFFPGGPITMLDPGPEADDWDRNLDVIRLANRTSIAFENSTLEVGAWYSYRGLDHAITRFAGIIDQNEHEAGIFGQLNGESSWGDTGYRWTFGWQANKATNDAKRWENNFGERGELTNRSDQDSSNLLFYGQSEWLLNDRLTAITGLQYLRAERDNAASLNDTSGDLEYDQVNPRFGLLYDLDQITQLYANVNRAFEPPSMSDLTAGGALDFTPLKAQKAWTAEVGTRGQNEHIAWDLSFYRSWVRRELLDFGEPGARGFVSFTDNADRTIHQGLELGLDIFIEPEVLRNAGHRIIWRNIYTWNDFEFDDDVDFGDNTLAGVPEHVYVTELRFDHARDWYLAVNLRWAPDGPFADFANTTEVPGYHIIGVNAGFPLSSKLSLYISAENIFDERYVSNVTTNANQALENSRLFTPGQGRGVFAGLTLRY